MKKIERNKLVSVKRQCELLDVARSSVYYKPEPVDSKDVELMNEIRCIYQKSPFYGYRKIHAVLKRKGYKLNRKKTQRLMKLIGLQAVYPRKKTTVRNPAHSKCPYALKKKTIDQANQAWMTDITYIRIARGFGYLMSLIDVYSRRVMGWSFSCFIDTALCLEAYANATRIAIPEIINSDKGSQFTSHEWVDTLSQDGILVSMDGKGRCFDNIYMERLWRSIKYELVYLHDIQTMAQARELLDKYITFYNNERPHQSLNYQAPMEVYNESINSSVQNNREGNQIVTPQLLEGEAHSEIQPVYLSK